MSGTEYVKHKGNACPMGATRFPTSAPYKFPWVKKEICGNPNGLSSLSGGSGKERKDEEKMDQVSCSGVSVSYEDPYFELN